MPCLLELVSTDQKFWAIYKDQGFSRQHLLNLIHTLVLGQWASDDEHLDKGVQM